MRRYLRRLTWLTIAVASTGVYFATRLPPTVAADEPTAVESDLAERGRYLAQLGNCVSCHTAQAGQPFAGGRSFQSPYAFLGNIYSSNITPDPDTGIGRWSEADFVRAMRTGVAPGGKRLFPAFPYPSFTKLSDTDLAALFAFLRTLPAMRVTPPPNAFWFRQRWAMWLWNALFLDPGALIDDPERSTGWNRGRYLVDGLGHCGACHTPRNLAMAERRDAPLTGGIVVDDVGEGRSRAWSAPNLTSVDSGLDKWSVEDLSKYLRSGANRHGGTFGPMNEVILNSTRYLTATDAASMAEYLKSLPGMRPESEQRLSHEQHETAQALYSKHCEECHLANGRGGFRKAPPLAGSVIVQSKSPASLLNVMLYGATPAAGLPPAFDAWEEMPGFGTKLDDAQIVLLANYVRSEWGNRGDKVVGSAVKRQR